MKISRLLSSAVCLFLISSQLNAAAVQADSTASSPKGDLKPTISAKDSSAEGPKSSKAVSSPEVKSVKPAAPKMAAKDVVKSDKSAPKEPGV